MEERRQAVRVPVVTVVVHQFVVTHLGKETWLEAGAADLSPQGVSVVLSDSLNSGESVYLLAAVSVHGKEGRDLSANAVTSNCRPTEDGRWRVGLKFLDVSEDEQERWADYLSL